MRARRGVGDYDLGDMRSMAFRNNMRRISASISNVRWRTMRGTDGLEVEKGRCEDEGEGGG